MGAHPHDDDAVEGGVGLPVSAAVQPVAAGLAARGRDRAGAAMAFSASLAWVRASTAVSRATSRWRIISTRLVPASGGAVAWAPRTARGGPPASR